MAADSGSDADKRENSGPSDPELANGDSVNERLEDIEFEESEGNSVAELRGKIDSNS